MPCGAFPDRNCAYTRSFRAIAPHAASAQFRRDTRMRPHIRSRDMAPHASAPVPPKAGSRRRVPRSIRSERWRNGRPTAPTRLTTSIFRTAKRADVDDDSASGTFLE